MKSQEFLQCREARREHAGGTEGGVAADCDESAFPTNGQLLLLALRWMLRMRPPSSPAGRSGGRAIDAEREPF